MHINNLIFQQVCTIEPSLFKTTSGTHLRPFDGRHLVYIPSKKKKIYLYTLKKKIIKKIINNNIKNNNKNNKINNNKK